jgi:hypothetical protein
LPKPCGSGEVGHGNGNTIVELKIKKEELKIIKAVIKKAVLATF